MTEEDVKRYKPFYDPLEYPEMYENICRLIALRNEDGSYPFRGGNANPSEILETLATEPQGGTMTGKVFTTSWSITRDELLTELAYRAENWHDDNEETIAWVTNASDQELQDVLDESFGNIIEGLYQSPLTFFFDNVDALVAK